MSPKIFNFLKIFDCYKFKKLETHEISKGYIYLLYFIYFESFKLSLIILLRPIVSIDLRRYGLFANITRNITNCQKIKTNQKIYFYNIYYINHINHF